MEESIWCSFGTPVYVYVYEDSLYIIDSPFIEQSIHKLSKNLLEMGKTKPYTVYPSEKKITRGDAAKQGDSNDIKIVKRTHLLTFQFIVCIISQVVMNKYKKRKHLS